MLPAAIIYYHQNFFFTLGLWATELDQRFTLQWISGPDYWTRRPWCPKVLDERPAGVRLSHSHYLHLFLSTRCGKFFTVGCVRLPATFSRSHAQATSYREETTYRVGSYGMPAYQGSSRESYFNSVRFDSSFSRRGELLSEELLIKTSIHMQILVRSKVYYLYTRLSFCENRLVISIKHTMYM